MDNTSLRDFNKGEGTYVADAVERSLLLPVDMEDLKNLWNKDGEWEVLAEISLAHLSSAGPRLAQGGLRMVSS